MSIGYFEIAYYGTFSRGRKPGCPLQSRLSPWSRYDQPGGHPSGHHLSTLKKGSLPLRSRNAGASTSATQKTPLCRLAYPQHRRKALCTLLQTQSTTLLTPKDLLGGRSSTARTEGHSPRRPRHGLGLPAGAGTAALARPKRGLLRSPAKGMV